jgi:hypothetical protein
MSPSEKAQAGRKLIEEAILDLLSSVPEGLRNVEVAKQLALDFACGEKHRNQSRGNS